MLTNNLIPLIFYNFFCSNETTKWHKLLDNIFKIGVDDNNILKSAVNIISNVVCYIQFKNLNLNDFRKLIFNNENIIKCLINIYKINTNNKSLIFFFIKCNIFLMF